MIIKGYPILFSDDLVTYIVIDNYPGDTYKVYKAILQY